MHGKRVGMAFTSPTHVGALPSQWWAVHVSGDLDVATGPALAARLDRILTRRPGDGVVLDLTAVPFMDCTGLRPLLRARARIADRFWLRGPQPPILRLLDLTGLTGTLRILPAHSPWPAEADLLRCGVIPQGGPDDPTVGGVDPDCCPPSVA